MTESSLTDVQAESGSTTATPAESGFHPARPAESHFQQNRTRAPLTRLLRSELSWVFRRPRTLIGLGLLAVVPVAIAIGITVAGDSAGAGGTTGAPGGGTGGPGDNGPAVFGTLIGNGLALPLISLSVALTMLLPLVGAMASADAIAGESSNGTLRALLIAPVGRLRVLLVKAFGVATVTLVACLLVAAVGAITGLIILGSDGLITLSGTTLGLGDALGRVVLGALWVTVQVWAVAAVALAISTFTDHPLVVMAVTLGMVIVFGVLSVISALDWLHPYLLSYSWEAIFDLLRDPAPSQQLLGGLGRAACYGLIGMSVAGARMITKDS